MTTAQKLAAVAANMPLLYAAGKKECEGQHFTTFVKGDGSDTLRFSMPFVPDCISALAYDPRAMAQTGAVLQVNIDRRALSYLAGFVMSAKPNVPYTSAMAHGALSTRLFIEGDTITIKELPCTYGTTQGVFSEGVDYVVMAQKYTDLTDAQRLTAFLQELSGKSGTFSLSKQIVTGAFPGADQENSETGESMNEDWNALIRQYAGSCTVALV